MLAFISPMKSGVPTKILQLGDNRTLVSKTGR
jgi:hypothetical protein